jgi:hypothetical protein
MIARVVDVADGNIYLEVESQIRFHAAYRTRSSAPIVRQNDWIEFHFARFDGRPCVLVEAVIMTSQALPVRAVSPSSPRTAAG